MGTPGWVTIVQPAMATFEQERGVATGAWQERFIDERIAHEQGGAAPTLAVEIEHYRCETMSWDREEAEADRRAQRHADRLGQPVLWQFDAWYGWATVQPTPSSPDGLALAACQAERLSLSDAALAALLSSAGVTTVLAARQVARGLACALGGKRLVVVWED
ncbi:hypothetical protein SE17_02655 [Kouleothrix aurantiaca]|uniref:Uncharacterized protein n=1 Tax=Kouleothrix aurantiaca TaxID=186479 RepID=A0A0P9DGH1_9CHLR|nr:hypothetical protein SE17_02655 [Kouleothrix aurantiaca]